MFQTRARSCRKPARAWRVATLLLAASCSDGDLNKVDAAPVGTIVSPPDGASAPLDEVVTFVGQVDDANGLDNLDEILWRYVYGNEVAMCASQYADLVPLEGGKAETTCTFVFDDHALDGKTVEVEMLVTDDQALAAQVAPVSVTLYDPAGILVEFVDPDNGQNVPADVEIPVMVYVTNVPDGPNPRLVKVVGGEDVLCEADLDEDDVAMCDIVLAEGTHQLRADLYGEVVVGDTADTAPAGVELLASSEAIYVTADAGLTDVDEDGYSAEVDCDDEDPEVHPGAQEAWYDGVDQDCDGANDYDQDADGFEDGETSAVGTDCDDLDEDVNPAAEEVCDGFDQDCDGLVDQGVTLVFYEDGDGDGYGDAGAPVDACERPDGWVDDGEDCDDAAATVRPDASETCNGVDDDCDGDIDDGVGSYWYVDADGDGYGSGAAVQSCSAPSSGYVTNASDCNDGESAAWSGASETCDSVDNDCDGSTDEGLFTTYYRDADGDGYGTSSTTSTTCSGRPSGYVSNDDDCDDGESAVYPSAPDACDGQDNDCDSTDGSDESSCSPFTITFYDDDYNSSSCTETRVGTGVTDDVTALGCTSLNYPDRHAMMVVVPSASCVAGATITLWDYSGCNPSHGSTVVTPSCSTTEYYDLNCMGSGGIADEIASVTISR